MELTHSRTPPLRLLQIGVWDSLADAQEHALVVVAMGMDCSIHPMAGGGYEGPGRSPDRADALVWALSELMLGRKAEPRVRGL